MNVTHLESTSLWLEEPRPEFRPITEPATFDVAVIGGGITGLTAAYLLKRAGKRVAVFEKERIGCAETAHTTAHLTYVTDLKLQELVSTFRKESAQLVWMAGKLAIDTIEEIIRQEGISCGFQRVPGFLHASLTGKHDESAELLHEADLAGELGFDAAFVDWTPVQQKPGVRYADQALFDPIAYLSGLAQAIHRDGCEVHEHSELTEATTGPLTLTVNAQPVHCEKLVIATHVPLTGVNGLVSAMVLQSKLAGYSTYAVGGVIPEGAIPYGSYNDTADPYHYLRVHRQGDYDYAILGGKDHKTGQANDAEARYAALETLLKKVIPGAEVDHRWSGQVIETNDGLPYIGPSTEDQFVATGYSGNGMTFGTLSGMMACDWVLGRENPWSGLLSPSRTKVWGGTWDYLKENKDYPYHLVKGFLKPAQGDSFADLQPGQGEILKLNGERRAVFRTPQGEIKNCSAICTHLGCVVRWNAAEHTWDCPCHGSRFGTDGQVLAGPAESPLKRESSSSLD